VAFRNRLGSKKMSRHKPSALTYKWRIK